MAKKNFEKSVSKENQKVNKGVDKGIKDAKLGNAVIDHLVNNKVEAVKTRVMSIAEKATDKIATLEKECEKAANIKPDNNTYSEEGLVSSSYKEETYKKKQEPFIKLKALTEAFDAACVSGAPEDFYKLEKLLK